MEVLKESILALVAKTMFNHCHRKSKVFDSTFNEIKKFNVN